jgi:ABC-2 type transport system permease protein
MVTLFFVIASPGMGIMISNIVKTQMQASQMAFAILLPSILLSGFIFPRDGMPRIIYYIGAVIETAARKPMGLPFG